MLGLFLPKSNGLSSTGAGELAEGRNISFWLWTCNCEACRGGKVANPRGLLLVRRSQEFAIQTVVNVKVITAQKHFISGLIITRFWSIISVLSMED